MIRVGLRLFYKIIYFTQLFVLADRSKKYLTGMLFDKFKQSCSRVSTLKGRRFKCKVNKFRWLKKKIKNNSVTLGITSQKSSFLTIRCLEVH